jgi:hypothetical protein
VLEVENVTEVGAAPFVDGLIRIADDGDVAVDFRKAADRACTADDCVLVLVDHHVLELARVELANLLRLFEKLDRLQQQVVEIERVGVLQRLQIALVDPGSLFFADVPAAAKRLRPFHPVLRLADPPSAMRGGTSLSSIPSSRCACLTTRPGRMSRR